MSAAETATPKTQRRRRASTGGLSMKLDAPQRPGFVRRWVNNDPGRIIAMQELGYDFVLDAAGDGKARSDSEGTRIARYVGKDGEGAPMRAFLMETPQEEYQRGVEEKEEALKPFDEAIRRGDDTAGRLENAYSPSNRSSINRG